MFAPDCVRELHSAQTSISGQHAGSEIFEQKRMSHFDNIAALLQLQLLCADGRCEERRNIHAFWQSCLQLSEEAAQSNVQALVLYTYTVQLLLLYTCNVQGILLCSHAH